MIKFVGSGYHDPGFSNGGEKLNTLPLTSTSAAELETTEKITSTHENIPERQLSNCRDKKIWCNLADCSLGNVKQNCQKTCNLC